MTPEHYDEKAQQCLDLMRSCVNPRALKALQQLADEYTGMAQALRHKGAEELEADYEEWW
jgi:hypothetical protein